MLGMVFKLILLMLVLVMSRIDVEVPFALLPAACFLPVQVVGCCIFVLPAS